MFRFSLFDFFKISWEEDFWDFHVIYDFWSCVVWSFEIKHSVFDGIAFLDSALFFFDNSRDESGDCFDHQHGWGFSSEDNKLSKRDFFESWGVFFLEIEFASMINSFISSADKDKVIFFALSVGYFLRKKSFWWSWKKDWEIRIFCLIFDDFFYGIDDRLCLEKHACSTSVDEIIDLLVWIGAFFSWIVEFYF